MDIEEMLEIHDCPLCDGGSLLEEESGCGYYVMCLDCGCHSVTIDFHSEEERLEAAKKTVMLWNAGKVILISLILLLIRISFFVEMPRLSIILSVQIHFLW